MTNTTLRRQELLQKLAIYKCSDASRNIKDAAIKRVLDELLVLDGNKPAFHEAAVIPSSEPVHDIEGWGIA